MSAESQSPAGAEITKERAIDLVNEMQNAGILFRKRRLQADEVVNATELPEDAARRYARQLLQLQEGLKERDWDLSMVTEDGLVEWALNLIDRLSKPKTQINRGGSLGPVISGIEVSIPESQNVLADAARMRARTRIERNSGEII